MQKCPRGGISKDQDMYILLICIKFLLRFIIYCWNEFLKDFERSISHTGTRTLWTHKNCFQQARSSVCMPLGQAGESINELKIVHLTQTFNQIMKELKKEKGLVESGSATT